MIDRRSALILASLISTHSVAGGFQLFEQLIQLIKGCHMLMMPGDQVWKFLSDLF